MRIAPIVRPRAARASCALAATLAACIAAVPATLPAQTAALSAARPVASVPSARIVTKAAAAPADVRFAGTMPFPEAVDHHVAFVTSGTRGDWLHVVGGHTQGRYNRVTWKARIAADGSLGEWSSGPALATKRAGMALASDARYALLAGGRDLAGKVTNDVHIAMVWGDGRLGDWYRATWPMPAPRAHTAAAIGDRWVYVVGGTDGAEATSTVYRTRIDRTGRTGTWTTLAPLPAARSHHAAFVHEGALYVVAGQAADGTPHRDVLRAPILEDGSLGAYATVATIDADFATHGVAVKDGALYVIGGVADRERKSDRVLRATFAADGTLGAWEQVDAEVPVARTHAQVVPVLRDKLFSVGGSRRGRAMDDVVIGTFTTDAEAPPRQ